MKHCEDSPAFASLPWKVVGVVQREGGTHTLKTKQREVTGMGAHGCLIKLRSTIPFIFRPQTNLLLDSSSWTRTLQ